MIEQAKHLSDVKKLMDAREFQRFGPTPQNSSINANNSGG